MSRVTFQANNDGTISLKGTLTVETVSDAWSEAISRLNHHDKLIFNLRDITHSDSSGLAMLSALTKEAYSQGKEIHFTRLPEQMLATARVSGVESVLPIRD